MHFYKYKKLPQVPFVSNTGCLFCNSTTAHQWTIHGGQGGRLIASQKPSPPPPNMLGISEPCVLEWRKHTCERGRILASRKVSIKKIQFRPPSFPVFLSPTCTLSWWDGPHFIPPSKGACWRNISPQTNLPQELSRWRLAPPGGRTGNSASTRQEAGESPAAPRPPSLLRHAVVSYFWNMGTSLSSDLVLKGTFQPPPQISTVKVAHVLQNLTCVPKCHHYRPLDLY